MSSPVDTATMTITERSAQATRNLYSSLGLGAVRPADLKYLALALAQVATEEVARNTDFAERLRTLYQALLPAKPSRRSSTSTSSPKRGGPAGTKLIPVGTVDEALLDPYAPPNPFALQQLYGNEQLALALDRYTLTKLREAIPVVQERFPGAQPKNKTKTGIIDYIVEHVAGPGY